MATKTFFMLCMYFTGFMECTVDDQCSGECMRTYFRRFGPRCAKQLKKETYQLTCADYIRLHDGGPDGCSSSKTLDAWAEMNRRCPIRA